MPSRKLDGANWAYLDTMIDEKAEANVLRNSAIRR